MLFEPPMGWADTLAMKIDGLLQNICPDFAFFCPFLKNTCRIHAGSRYKRSPALTNSTWYKGMLHSQMAGTADNNGAFDFVISIILRGTQPPPHVHSREDEFF